MPIELTHTQEYDHNRINPMAKKFLLAAMAFLTLGALDRLSANVIIDIDQTGANDPVSATSPRAWNFGITTAGAAYFSANGITFDTAIFDAKIHSGATDPLVFTLYSGLGGNQPGNTVLATVTHAANTFNNQYGGTAASTFDFTGLSLTTGYYSVTLTSSASSDPNSEYFLKQGMLALENSNGTTLNSSFWLQAKGTGNATSTLALVPEPNAAWAAALIAGVSIGGSFLRRFQRKPAPATR